MKTLNIQAVLFDMDGVITNTMPDHYACWKKVFADEGIHVTHEQVYAREGQKGIESVLEIFEEHGKPCSLKHAKEILKIKERMFKKLVRRRYITGARAFLKDLKKQGFLLGLVTGTSRKELHKILPDTLHNLFDAVITGSDVKQGKPNPEPYAKCLKVLKIKKEGAAVIENAPFGIRSAKAAGLSCIAITTSLPKEYLRRADHIFRNIKDLRAGIKFRFREIKKKS